MEGQKHLQSLLTGILQRHTTAAAGGWLQQKAESIAAEGEAATALYTAFAAVPRQTGTAAIALTQKEKEAFLQGQPRLQIDHWPLDRLARVWLLMHIDARDKDTYIQKVENLFITAAAVNEQVALYSALPLLHYAEAWRGRCAEGIRSNIGSVLQAIMCHNDYPAQYLDESAWNQLVLKAFFTGKPINEICGLDARANRELAQILTDYAHERWAAGRPVNGLLWRCVAPYVDETNFGDVVRLSQSNLDMEREVAALVCRQSNYALCKDLLQQPALQPYAHQALSWQRIAEKAIE